MKSELRSLPSNRTFGFLFAGVFVLLSAYGFYKGAGQAKVYAWLTAGAFVALIAVIAPGVLTPFNKAWMRLGELMGKVVSPLVLGIFFFLLITPAGLILRLIGRDELRLKRSSANSYWVDRTPPGPASESFNHQF